MRPVDPSKAWLGRFREADDAILRFSISDVATGAPLSGANPSAWMDLLPAEPTRDTHSCKGRIEALLGASIFSGAALDLNDYHVLVLNQDATISVVDPRFGFGNTQLLALIPLKSRGEDWALMGNQLRLFVSMPAAGEVAVIDTASWRALRSIDVGTGPRRLFLQPDQHYLWVAFSEADPATSGVAVIDTLELRVAARIATGSGAHSIAFSTDSRLAFVTNRDAGSISVIDTRKLEKQAEITTSRGPVSIAFSDLSQRAYVVHLSGSIAVIAGDRTEMVRSIQAEQGLTQIRFAPGGRWGFVLNPEAKRLHIIDASENRIVQTGNVARGPEQISFSDDFAYVRQSRSETVLMIPLADVGTEGKPLSAADFPAGQNAFDKVSGPTPADAIVRVPGANAVLVANPADKAVYYYEEGMAAPKGQFSNYGREARAVLAADHSLKERAPGVYEAIRRLPRSGRYLIPVMLRSPALIHCFEVTLDANPEIGGKRGGESVRVEPVLDKRVMRVGESVRLRFRLTDMQTSEAVSGLRDVRVLTTLAPGVDQRRQYAVPDGPGIYAVDFAPAQSGTYFAFVECLSHGLSFGHAPGILLEVKKH
jgi:YVTN family beta-propeller protein